MYKSTPNLGLFMLVLYLAQLYLSKLDIEPVSAHKLVYP